MSLPEIIIPDPSPGPRTGELYQEWREAKDFSEEKFTPRNIQFTHDPEWREFWLSMESAKNKRGIWRAVWCLFWGSEAAWAVNYYWRF